MKEDTKKAIMDQIGNAVKVVSSKRTYAVVGTYIANRQVLKLAEQLHPAVVVTMIVCFTLLGLAYIASETIRKK